MYAEARRGSIRNFTGIDDPYEEPLAPDVVKLDTVERDAETNASAILAILRDRGFLAR